MRELFEQWRDTVTAKVLFIGFLALLMLIPMRMIEGLIAERGRLLDIAHADIANAWGGEQIVGGPILVVPFRFTRYFHNGVTDTVVDEIYVLPEALSIEGDIDTQVLRRGLYEVPVYSASLSITGRIAAPVINSDDYDDLEILWDEAQIVLPLTDARSIKEPVRLTLGDASVDFQPGGTRVAGFGNQLIVPYAAFGLGRFDDAQAFSFELKLGGSDALRFLPLGDETRVSLNSAWPSPSFGGAYLPQQRSVTDSGFSANWRVLSLGRGYPQSWMHSETTLEQVGDSAFGVEFIIPIGIHEGSLRAAKYAVLFIGLSFVLYFLFEIFAPIRLHALQYLLVGMANCIFYLLLLGLAEHAGFGFAYAVSASASTALIGGYSAAILASGRRALPVVAMLAGLYGYLYVTLKAEDYALLSGALGLFAILSAFMYLTRRVDWFAVSFESAVSSADDVPVYPPNPA